MKIYLGIEVPEKQGYVTVDPASPGGNKVPALPTNLDVVCDDAECTEILADEILDYIHGSKLIEVIEHWKKKLRHGGRLIIGGTDMISVCSLVVGGNMNVSEANKHVFGMQESAWKIKTGCYSLYDVREIIKSSGLKLIKSRPLGTKFIVEAERE